MTFPIKPKSTEITVTSANNVYNSTLVRALNSGAGVSLVTMAYANGTTYATFSVAGNAEVWVRKASTDTIQGTNIKAAQVA